MESSLVYTTSNTLQTKAYCRMPVGCLQSLNLQKYRFIGSCLIPGVRFMFNELILINMKPADPDIGPTVMVTTEKLTTEFGEDIGLVVYACNKYMVTGYITLVIK